jgi:hypothetical protein
VTSTESFNKSIEMAQKYYNEAVQNYLNFVNKIGRKILDNLSKLQSPILLLTNNKENKEYNNQMK